MMGLDEYINPMENIISFIQTQKKVYCRNK